ncbi:leucyl/phenylalanyl-tRNA--protein transferase [Oceanicaulis alexandrii]|uniref:leucyl/phenylalanyl-tRNA--protein transferase n=1 Tax=Oceanicaulis alexandrii TaxID=153233 RepID=UPI0035D0915B
MRGFGVQELLACYARGVFPMAESRSDSRVYLLEPDERGVIPLDGFHIPKSLRKTVRRDAFALTVNRCFETVVRSCAAPAPGREDSWINDQILTLYLDMHAAGHAHSIEAWKDGKLAGGLYGVSLGGAFFGESMFSRETDASKVALVSLVARLNAGGYALLDTQFNTEHLKRFGAQTISQHLYRERLDQAVELNADFFALPEGVAGDQLLQSITQTS